MVIFLKRLLFLDKTPWSSMQHWCLAGRSCSVLCDKPLRGTPHGQLERYL